MGRYMRVIVFFDLPSVTNQEKRVYRRFRKFLITEGFIQMQESVYSKLALNASMSKLIVEKLKKNVPEKGLVEVLVITEKQFAQIIFLVGNKNNPQVDSEERLLVL